MGGDGECSPTTAASWRSRRRWPTWTGRRRWRCGASRPTTAHIELCIPTVHDPSLAPGGQRTSSRSTSTRSRTRWPSRARGTRSASGVADRAIAQLGELLPRSCRARSCTARCSRRSTWSGCWASPAGMRCTATWPPTSCSHCGRCAGYGDYRTPVRGALPVRRGHASRRRRHRRQRAQLRARGAARRPPRPSVGDGAVAAAPQPGVTGSTAPARRGRPTQERERRSGATPSPGGSVRGW